MSRLEWSYLALVFIRAMTRISWIWTRLWFLTELQPLSTFGTYNNRLTKLLDWSLVRAKSSPLKWLVQKFFKKVIKFGNIQEAFFFQSLCVWVKGKKLTWNTIWCRRMLPIISPDNHLPWWVLICGLATEFTPMPNPTSFRSHLSEVGGEDVVAFMKDNYHISYFGLV